MISSADYHLALENLPVATFESLVGDRTIFVIAPHPDDESMGCGGLLAWAASHGRRVEVLFLTDGEASHPGSAVVPAIQLGKIRMREAIAAAEHLGVPSGSLDFMHLPDGSLPGMSDHAFSTITEQLRLVIGKLAPCMVCVTASTDPHGDHQMAHRLAVAAMSGLEHCRLLAYPVWSWVLPAGENVADPHGFRVDIAEAREKKRGAIAAHASQHGRVVTDSPKAFVLPKRLLDRLDRGYEVYLEA
ncbi:PIG-L family deacetylase [Rhodanobacter sp. L36]|uniref:PIG-L deacetylase family protein n=1 Tax=Rhodanobacter sp. L36 TaxID=1747221 RepID=UPI00131E938E|nr:PIG-L family deacetylase [Rhodanobacter sp. L36]